MGTSLLFVVSSLVYVSVGAAAGWWIRGSSKKNVVQKNSVDQPEANSPPVLDQEKAKEFLHRMHELASVVSQDVGDHGETLTQAQQELTALSDNAADATSAVAIQVITGVIESNVKLRQKLDKDRETIQDLADQMQVQKAAALSDELTRLPNRRAFDRELERRFAEWDRRQTPASLVLLDIDHFKKFNDEHGHQAGDEVLRGVGKALADTVRTMDVAARYGGEEFAAILPNTELDPGINIAQRLRRAIESRVVTFNKTDFQVTASFGLAQINPGDDVASLIQRADEALYASKEAGRNCVHLHDGECCRLAGSAPEKVTKEAPPTETSKAKPENRKKSPTKNAPSRDQPKTNSPAKTDPRTDPETGLPNRILFDEELSRRVAERRRHHSPLSVMLVEVDRIKELNEQFGTKAVQLALATVPRFLTAAARETDLVAHYGDNQFAVVLAHSNLTGAKSAAERMRSAIARCDKIHVDGTPVTFTISVGVGEAQDGEGAELLADRVEAALVSSKTSEHPCAYFHDGAMCHPVDVEGPAPLTRV